MVGSIAETPFGASAGISHPALMRQAIGGNEMNAVEVKQDDTGAYQIVGEPEAWEYVCRTVQEVRHCAPLIGWAPYTRVYAVEDRLGNVRRYFVAE